MKSEDMVDFTASAPGNSTQLPSTTNPFDSVDFTQAEIKKPSKKMSSLEAGITSFNAGIERFTNTILSVGAKALDKTGVTSRASELVDLAEKKRLESKKQAYESSPVAAGVGEAASFLGAGLLTPSTGILAGATGAGAKIGSAAIEGLTSGAATGLLAMPEEGKTRLQQATEYGALGAVAGGVLRGTVEGVRGAKASIGKLVDPAAENLVKMANDYNMPTSLESILKKSTVRDFTKGIMDRVPFSATAKLHEDQAKRYEPIIKSMMYKLSETADDAGLDKALSGENMIAQFSKMKATARPVIDKAFDNLDNISEQLGSKVSLKNFKDSIEESITQELNATNPDKALVARLKSYLKYGDEVPFKVARKIRSEMGTEFARANSPKGDAAHILHYGRGAAKIGDDLDKWGNNPQNGSVFDAYQYANGLYKPYQTVFKNPQIMAAMKDTASMYNYIGTLVKDKNPEHLGKAIRYADEATNNLMRARQIQEGLNTSMFTKDGEHFVDVNKFSSFMNDAKKAQGTLWGNKIDEIQGFARFLEAHSGGSRTNTNSQGGYGTGLLTAGGIATTALFNPGLAGVLSAVAVSAKALSNYLTSKPLQNMFLRWSKLSSAASPAVKEGLKAATLKEMLKVNKLKGITAISPMMAPQGPQSTQQPPMEGFEE